jgi:cytochrome c biogenesis protein CcmG/thiol:disulfide interchange protein DsbE
MRCAQSQGFERVTPNRVETDMEVSKYCREWVAGVSVAAMLVLLPDVGSSAESFQLSEYEGKVVVLDFWASWCVPCRRSFPWMNQMHQKYADEGLVIVAVNLDNNAVDAAAFLREYPPNFRIVYDTDKTLARSYGIQAMPSSILVGRDGEPVDVHLGFKVKQQPEYEAAIREALGQNDVHTQDQNRQ